jgi:hypothetical protein
VQPDFTYDGAGPDPEVLFLHRKLSDGDAYFLNSRSELPQAIQARFRVTGKAPELWRAETGQSERVSYRIENGETLVPLELGPHDSVFVVFREPTKLRAFTAAKATWSRAMKLDGPWEVSFQPGRGAPASSRLATLAPLNDNADPRIKYFSGVASYRTTFQLPAGARAGQNLMLDLGKVGDIAEVVLNGKLVGTPWNAPYRVNVSHAVRPGPNTLEVRVANLWVNRLIGDLQPGAEKITFTTLPTYKPDAPLRPSGLIGPVELLVGR